MDENARMRLWQDYTKTKSSDIREKLILEYAPLVKLVAGRLSMYLGYNVEYDDLVSYGIFGLIDAIDKFDHTKPVKFETYASLRIRGAILDQIRKMDWIPRTIRQKQKQIDAAMKEFEVTHGRQATDAELAEQLGIKEEARVVSSFELDVISKEFSGNDDQSMIVKEEAVKEVKEQDMSEHPLVKQLRYLHEKIESYPMGFVLSFDYDSIERE